MSDDRISTLFDHLHRGGAWAHYWTPNTGEFYADKYTGEQTERKISFWFPTEKRPPIPASWADRNVYFCVHPQHSPLAPGQRARLENTAALNCFYAEFDAKDYESKSAILAHLETLPLYPTVTIDSGGGYHGYWLLEHTLAVDNGNRDQLKKLQWAWVRLVGGDPGASDLARVLRAPGTQNRKEKYAPNYPPVTIYEARFSRLFRLTDFEQLTNELRAIPTVAPGKIAVNRAVGANADVIATFNANHKIEDVLSAYGYTRAHGDRWVRPGGENGSVHLKPQENISFHHNTQDVLHKSTPSGGLAPMDPFEAFTLFEHKGDHEAAYIDAKKLLGLWVDSRGNGLVLEPPAWVVDAPNMEGESIATDAPIDISQSNQQEDDQELEQHPLDVTTNEALNLGWIDTYTRIITEMTGSPAEFNQLAGMITIAVAIQRKAVLRMSFSDIYPNIYGCVIARSSVYHKSSSLQKPRLLLQRANLDRLLLSELMTSEGLLKELRGQSSGVILRDEIGTLFDSHNTKYLRQLKPDLTAIFDCYPYSRRLSNEEIKVEKPYLSILGATTPQRFFEGVSQTDWVDGFLARWLFVTPTAEPNFDAMTSLYTNKHAGDITTLAWKLIELDRKEPTDFILTGDAHALWDAWQRQAAKDAYYFGDDITAAIVTRYSAYALKFAIILAAVNGTWGTITPDEMQTAIHLADSYKMYVHKLLQERGRFGINGAKLQKIFKMIQRPPKNKAGMQLTATRKTLMQYANMRKGELDPCIEKLLDIGAILEDGKRFVPNTVELPIKSWKQQN